MVDWNKEDDEEKGEEYERDPGVNLAVVEDLRQEDADRAREILGLPAPKSNVVDAELEFVLFYIAHCADYHQIEEGEGQYSHETALYDLSLLVDSIAQVEKQIKDTQKTGRKFLSIVPKKDGKKESCEIVSSGNAIYDAMIADWEKHYEGVTDDPKEPEAKAEVITIGRRKEA